MNLNDAFEGQYIKRFDYDADGNAIYVGRAAPGTASSTAAWSIQRMTYLGGRATLVEFAGGNNQMAAVWDNRASLSYS